MVIKEVSRKGAKPQRKDAKSSSSDLGGFATLREIFRFQLALPLCQLGQGAVFLLPLAHFLIQEYTPILGDLLFQFPAGTADFGKSILPLERPRRFDDRA